MLTREISSRAETRPRTKSSLSMVKCLLLLTRFSRDEISSWDELIPVTACVHVKFHPGTKSSLSMVKCVLLKFHPGTKCQHLNHVTYLCFFNGKMKKKRFFYFLTSSNQYFVHIKPDFTDFRFCTPSLGSLQNFVFVENSDNFTERTPNFQET